MMSKYKKHLKEIIVISFILIVSIICSVFIFIPKGDELIAKIYHHNDLLLTVNLSKEDQERILDIEELNDLMKIEVKHNAIRVKSSTCPHKDCVNMGYVSTSIPIVCAYHKVNIDVRYNNSESDVII